jgi:hypothetical protein
MTALEEAAVCRLPGPGAAGSSNRLAGWIEDGPVGEIEPLHALHSSAAERAATNGLFMGGLLGIVRAENGIYSLGVNCPENGSQRCTDGLAAGYRAARA